MKLIGKLEVGGHIFSMKDSEGTVYLKQLGLPDNFYGGYVTEFRKTRFGIYLVLDRKGNLINLGYTDDSLTDAGRELLFGKHTIPDAPVYGSIPAEVPTVVPTSTMVPASTATPVPTLASADVPPESMLEFEPFIKPQEIIMPVKGKKENTGKIKNGAIGKK